ncbi:MAG: hypothetical protein ABIP20_10175 [Chthoniobacteraceae bacterium]
MKTCRTFRHLLLATFLAATCLSRTASAQDATVSPAKLDPPVKPSVTGKFIGDGKEAAIKFVLVEERDGFDGKPALRLIFTEKDPSTAKNPSFDASFRKFGSAVVLSVFYDGQIFGCEVAHTAHKKSGFSSVGEIKMPEFKIVGGNVTGHVSTGGTLDAFGQKWEVDLTFAAPLPDKLRTASATPPKPGAMPTAPGETPAKRAKTPKAAKVAATPTLSAKSLPLPKDATDVQYKALVEQIQLTSGQSVAAVTSELSAGLKAQGWKDGRGELKGPKNAILKRELGDAKLTIMIQPAPTGSTIKIFADGLNWDGVESATPPAAGNPAADINAIQKEAEKALKDAFKDLPKGL